MYFHPQIDLELSSPYTAVQVEVDGEDCYLFLINPIQIAKLPFWLRDYLMKIAAHAIQQSPTGGGERTPADNVIQFDPRLRAAG